MTEHDPRSRFEDEGIPDLQDGTPQQQWAEDPQEHPLPGDRPVAVHTYGTTAEEQRQGEPLDGRLARERPDVGVEGDDTDGAYPVWSADEPAGRLVEDDEGVRTDTEKDAVANEVGADGGGFTAEEEAVRVRPE
jgi:uncharacterized protein DUF5709